MLVATVGGLNAWGLSEDDELAIMVFGLRSRIEKLLRWWGSKCNFCEYLLVGFCYLIKGLQSFVFTYILSISQIRVCRA
jgi:hypothetical protein